MTDQTKKRLLDAFNACRAIRQFTAGKDFTAYTADSMLKAAVERKFEILGEALSRAEESDPGLAAKLPEIRRIVGMRNRIIHGYDSVDDEIVWDTVESKISPLFEDLSALLREDNGDRNE